MWIWKVIAFPVWLPYRLLSLFWSAMRMIAEKSPPALLMLMLVATVLAIPALFFLSPLFVLDEIAAAGLFLALTAAAVVEEGRKRGWGGTAEEDDGSFKKQMKEIGATPRTLAKPVASPRRLTASPAAQAELARLKAQKSHK